MKRHATLLSVLAVVVVACATTQQTRSVEPSGFLRDYSELAPGNGEQALLVYISRNADFSGYEQIVVDPVTIWQAEGSRLEDVPREDLQRLADYLETALRRELAHEFRVVERPGPATLRLRSAITEAQGSRVALDLVSTVIPPARLLAEVKKLATGTHAFVGRAAIEVEILDSLTNERLIAAVDERAGSKALRGSTGTWSDVQEAYDYWAELISQRLAAFRRIDQAL